MDKPQHDLALWIGIAIVCAVLFAFFVLVKYQPGFFSDFTLTQ